MAMDAILAIIANARWAIVVIDREAVEINTRNCDELPESSQRADSAPREINFLK